MQLKQIVDKLQLSVKCGADQLDREVSGGYASDLLSDVIAHAEKGDLWLTLQLHPNVVAVATLKELAAVLLVGGREPEADTLRRAEEQKIVILSSPKRSFELAGKLFDMGISGER